MTRIHRRRSIVAAGFASLALLVGASSASAELPSLNLNLNADKLSTEIDSNAVRGQLNREVSGQLAKVGAEARTTQRKLRRSLGKLKSIERKLNRDLRSSGARTRSDLSRAQRRTQSRIRALRAKLRRLGDRAVAQAKSSANGAWVVVNRSGKVLDQSGGISVAQSGNTYRVSWDMSRGRCLELMAGSTGSSPISAYVGAVPAGIGSVIVTTSAASGSRGTGFYLAAAC